MDRWIRDAINSVVQGTTALINAVLDRVMWVYNVFIGVFIRIRSAFDGAINGIRAHFTSLYGLANEVFATLYWIRYIFLPQFIHGAVTGAIDFLIGLLNDAITFIHSTIDTLRDWAIRQLNRIDAFVDQIIRWATTTFNTIWDTLTRVRDIVIMLLTDPKRLAVWAIDAIMGEVLRWIDRNADRIFQAVRQRSIAITMQAADRIEDMIARLL